MERYYDSEDHRNYLTGTQRDKHYFPHSPVTLRTVDHQKVAWLRSLLDGEGVGARDWTVLATSYVRETLDPCSFERDDAYSELARLSGEVRR